MTFEAVRNVQLLFNCFKEIDKYRCTKCTNFYTDSLVTLNYHVISGHRDWSLKEDVYKCLKCLFVTHSKYFMGRHSSFSECVSPTEEEKKKRFVCYRTNQIECNFSLKDECEIFFDKRFTNANQMEANQNLTKLMKMFDCSNKIDKYKCNKCSNFQTNSLVTLNYHVRSGHRDWRLEEEVHKCLKCWFVTNSKYLIELHSLFSECVASNKNEKKERFVCYKTSETEYDFNLKGEFHKRSTNTNRVELNKNLTKSTKSECDNFFKYRQSQFLAQRSSQDIPTFECDQCTSKFRQRKYLKRHIKHCHSKPEDVQWFQCEKCPYKSIHIHSVKNHTIARHLKPEDIQWFQCEQCHLKFKIKSHLGSHIKCCHSNPEDISWYECPECPYKCKKKSNLVLHMKSRHVNPEDINWHECEQCPWKFKRRCDLLRHMRRLHTKTGDLQSSRHSKPESIKWFQCDKCPYKCKQNGNLKKHVKVRHTNPNDIHWFHCEKCSYKSKVKGSLNTHIKRHHFVQWFPCGKCSSKFKMQSLLTNHIKMHHSSNEDIQWFHCEQCSYQSKDKKNLKRHVTLRHVNPEDIHWEQCEQCSSKFKAKAYLRSHIKLFHSKPENF